MQEFKSEDLRKAWEKAWSITDDAKLGEYLGEVKTDYTTFYFWKDAEEAEKYWYDTEANRQYQNMFRRKY